MRAKDGGHFVERPRLQHGGGAFTDLLGRLQHHEHVASGGVRGEQIRGAHCPRGMHIVATGVHHTRVDRRIGEPGGFLYGQRIDVAAHGYHRRVAVMSGDARDQPRTRDARDADRIRGGQRALECGAGTLFGERQLGMLVQVAP